MTPPPVPVAAVSTGRVRIRPKNIAGTGTPMLWWTLTSRTWSRPLPIWSFVVAHPSGTVLFDTGQDIASVTDAGYYPGGALGWIYRRQVSVDVGPADDLGAQLAALGHPLESLAFAAISHLHQDHAGGVTRLGDTPVLVSSAELALLDEKTPELHGVLSRHVPRDGVNWRPVDFDRTDDPALADFHGAHDVFGDGLLTLLPTPGHSTGSMSLLVRGEGAPLLLVGDATYDPSLMARGIVPDTGARATQLATTAAMVRLTDRLPGLTVLAAHDPAVPELIAAR